MNKPLTNGKVKLTGKDGNAFMVLGLVNLAIKKSDRPELSKEFMAEATSGDYDHLLQTCFKYVDVR